MSKLEVITNFYSNKVSFCNGFARKRKTHGGHQIILHVGTLPDLNWLKMRISTWISLLWRCLMTLS